MSGIGIGLGLPFTSRQAAQRSFVPTDLGGCVLWLQSNLGITYGIPPAVSAWADQSAGGNNYTQGVAANQPTDTGLAVQFDGTNDYLAGNNAVFGAGAYTIAFAVKWLTLNGTTTLWRDGIGGDGVHITPNGVPMAYRQFHRGAGAPNTVTWGNVTGSAERVIFRHSGGTNLADFRQNGVDSPQQALTQNLAGTASGCLGAYSVASQWCNADLYAVAGYSRRLSDAECDELDAYLAGVGV